nr:hypothetical protein [Tanacetum cinerariifolium]
MLEEMVRINLDSMLDKWNRISKGTMHGRMGLPIRMELVTLLLQGLRVLEMGIKPGDMDEIDKVNTNCILMANLQHAFTSGTQFNKAPVYDTDGSAELQLNDNCYDNKIFNMFTQEEQYMDLLEPIPEPQLVPQNDNHVTSVSPSVVQSGGTVEKSSAPNKKTRAHQETVYRNLVDQVAQNTLELAQKSREKMRFLKKEIKPANYAKINHLSGVFVPQTTKSKEELFLSNVSNMVTVSKTISIPNEDLSDDTIPSVARKFLNEVKNSLVTLQRVETKNDFGSTQLVIFCS